MEIRAEYKGISIDYATNKTLITFETSINPSSIENAIKHTENKPHRLIYEVARDTRSLNANSYFHVLVGKIADAQTMEGNTVSKTEVKNDLIADYGQPLIIDEQIQYIKSTIPPEVMRKQELMHCSCKQVKEENGISTYFYQVLRGSHTYDSYEMSVLINGTVELAKSLNIETMTPAELQRVIERWKSE